MHGLRRRTVVAIVVAVVLVAGGVVAGIRIAATQPTAAEQAAARLPAPRTIRWSRCTDPGLRALPADCGFLTVPLDWAAPRGTTVRLAVSRLRHTSSTYRGIVLMNPGGPGASGLVEPEVASSLPADVAGSYDWIGFDPRGVGGSRPALTCDGSYSDGPRPAYTAADAGVWVARAAGYDAACAHNGAILRHMTTVDSAKDMDYLRRALGRDRTSFYGWSYGTYLGQVYATLFPDRVDRMVLDSTVDPHDDDPDGFAGDEAFQTGLSHYFAWVAKWDGSYHLGTDAAAVRAHYLAVEHELAAHPVGGVGAAEWADTMFEAAYYQLYWTTLTTLFVKTVQHPDATTLGDAYRDYGAQADNGYAVLQAVDCTDWPQDRDVPKYLAAVAKEEPRAPDVAWSTALEYGLGCERWPVPSPAHPFHVDGSRVGGVLMVDETLDAATPYPGSLVVRSLFPGARLLAEPGGTSHAVTLVADDPCVTDAIAGYLRTGALPARATGDRADATCAPAPEPIPGP